MSKWRITVVGILVAAPTLFLAGYGSYQLWLHGLSIWVWWPMMGSLALAWILGWHWQRKQKLLRIDFDAPLHWTDRDKQAWKLVEQRAKDAEKLPSDKLVQFPFYAEVAQEMALELARVYHPGAKDPLSQLTLPEILSVIELAAHDLTEMIDTYLPGGHLMTINDWKNAKKASDYYQTASNIWWAVSAVFSPVNTAMRYLASQAGVSTPLAMLQQNLILWFYTAFLQRMGTYLIDLNSGRLRVGVKRYRELTSAIQEPANPQHDGTPDTGHRTPDISKVSVGLIGQVKAGKSSLVNALLGQQKARTHVLPETRDVARYELQVEGIPTKLEILDTVGYSHSGPREDQMPATQSAAQHADVLLLVMHARSAARQPDLLMMQKLRKWFDSRPELKMPLVIGVLTHIDLLAPATEWQPPYKWPLPAGVQGRTKEQQIDQAVQAAREQFSDVLAAVVPVCAADGRVFGVEEWLLPKIVESLGEARAVAMLRCLRAEVDARKMRKVVDQLLAAGKEIGLLLWEAAKK